MESICHLFPFRPYTRFIWGGYAGNIPWFWGQLTFYRYFTGSLRTALCNQYHNLFSLPSQHISSLPCSSSDWTNVAACEQFRLNLANTLLLPPTKKNVKSSLTIWWIFSRNYDLLANWIENQEARNLPIALVLVEHIITNVLWFL